MPKKDPYLYLGKTQAIILELTLMGEECAPERLSFEERRSLGIAFASQAIARFAPTALRPGLEKKFGDIFTVGGERARIDEIALIKAMNLFRMTPEERSVLDEQLAATQGLMERLARNESRGR